MSQNNFIVSASLTANSVGAPLRVSIVSVPLLILSAGVTVDGTFPVFFIDTSNVATSSGLTRPGAMTLRIDTASTAPGFTTLASILDSVAIV